MKPRVLVVRLDSLGDVLVCGPAIRAVAATAEVTVLAGPSGAPAARLLPGVADVIEWNCPWIAADPEPVEPAAVGALVSELAARDYAAAVVLTSFHQSALPTALLLRLAGVPRIAAVSTDYPGSLLDQRLAEPPDAPEPERMLAVAAAAGYHLPPGDPGQLQLRPTAVPPALPERYLVLHPGAAAPARTCSPPTWSRIVDGLLERGHRLVLTGSSGEAGLTRALAESAADGTGDGVTDLAGRLELAELAGTLAGAQAVVVGNTGPAHLAAAVGTPVVSLFAPVVPVERWAPYTARRVILTDPHAPCAGSRARVCPILGHPCLDRIGPVDVLRALAQLGVDSAVLS